MISNLLVASVVTLASLQTGPATTSELSIQTPPAYKTILAIGEPLVGPNGNFIINYLEETAIEEDKCIEAAKTFQLQEENTGLIAFCWIVVNP